MEMMGMEMMGMGMMGMDGAMDIAPDDPYYQEYVHYMRYLQYQQYMQYQQYLQQHAEDGDLLDSSDLLRSDDPSSERSAPSDAGRLSDLQRMRETAQLRHVPSQWWLPRGDDEDEDDEEDNHDPNDEHHGGGGPGLTPADIAWYRAVQQGGMDDLPPQGESPGRKSERGSSSGRGYGSIAHQEFYEARLRDVQEIYQAPVPRAPSARKPRT
eukprot:TRINITY_DN5764_c0_g1_i3.p1 TRINITY_DN5764_c0_g1~~TRINITY_DN5764_c0_g1_i3.p1  ORF type:complete len:211 (-),score=21.22 TRINITY_DN5764_c0_g1_i3:118-750(-)